MTGTMSAPVGPARVFRGVALVQKPIELAAVMHRRVGHRMAPDQLVRPVHIHVPSTTMPDGATTARHKVQQATWYRRGTSPAGHNGRSKGMMQPKYLKKRRRAE